ncbi:ComF family protein [Helicobacter sp. MIT 11-5569]|uniref:ComF family protein n=1 Tax=Helicobacter sp. MIT 11-5569 TaxID=1548151 RepID=UPI001F3082E8|nr:phosphoribosyltransferase family protein [Helicobacter sp. MIT 11-5569]
MELIPLEPTCRDLQGFKVYGFFEYGSVDMLLHAKYSVVGSKIYASLAQLALKVLKTQLKVPYNAYSVGIDDKISKQGYAHNAIFLRALKQVGLHPMYKTLHASNSVSYAGKDLEFRKRNPRNFILKRAVKDKQIVLVDDIITSGLTLLEAKECLEANGAKVLHAFVLADASTK